MEYAYFKRVTLVNILVFIRMAWHLQPASNVGSYLCYVDVLCVLCVALRLREDENRGDTIQRTNRWIYLVSHDVPSRLYRYQPFSAANMIYRWLSFKLCFNCCWAVTVFPRCWIFSPKHFSFHHSRLLFHAFFMLYLLSLYFAHSVSVSFFRRTKHFFCFW